MKLDFNIQLNQKQGLALTAQVQQAIKLLHMTNLEIQEFVSDQFQDNPFIETNTLSEQSQEPQTSSTENNALDKTFEEKPYAKQETETKVAVENQFETGEGYIPRSTVSKADNDFDTVSLIRTQDKSLYGHCLEFINSIFKKPPITHSLLFCGQCFSNILLPILYFQEHPQWPFLKNHLTRIYQTLHPLESVNQQQILVWMFHQLHDNFSVHLLNFVLSLKVF